MTNRASGPEQRRQIRFIFGVRAGSLAAGCYCSI